MGTSKEKYSKLKTTSICWSWDLLWVVEVLLSAGLVLVVALACAKLNLRLYLYPATWIWVIKTQGVKTSKRVCKMKGTNSHTHAMQKRNMLKGSYARERKSKQENHMNYLSRKRV